MEYIVGVLLALAILLFASAVGFDRDRSFYPTILCVIASYYDLFAIMGGSTRALLGELIVTAAFVALSAVGFRLNPWLIVGGLVAHGIFDFVHGGLIDDPGVPNWWPMFCLTFDVTAGAYLAWRLRRRSVVIAESNRLK
jgi:hypothetical protein